MGRRFPGQYPSGWQRIAEAVKARAGWRCERCGHPHEPPWRRLGRPELRAACDGRCRHPPDDRQRVLTVHHLDGDKSNCADWNLAALCQVCHLQVQGRVRMRQLWMLEHSPWMVPHVAGMLEGREG